MTETGIAILGPLLWVAGTELVGAIVSAVTNQPKTPGDAPLPFGHVECAWGNVAGWPVYADGSPPGTRGGISLEQFEAYQRVDLLLDLASGCEGLSAAEREDLRRGLYAYLNGGVHARPLVMGGTGYYCDPAERPTRNQVRAALAELAVRLGKVCRSGELEAVAATVQAPLSQSVARASVPVWAWVVGLLAVGGLVWAWGRR